MKHIAKAHYFRFNYVPTTFDEVKVKTVRSRTLSSITLPYYLLSLLNKKWFLKKGVIFIGDLFDNHTFWNWSIEGLFSISRFKNFFTSDLMPWTYSNHWSPSFNFNNRVLHTSISSYTYIEKREFESPSTIHLALDFCVIRLSFILILY